MRKTFLVVLTLIAVLISACGTAATPALPTAGAPTELPTPGQPTAPAPTPIIVAAEVQTAAIAMLAEALGLSPDEIAVIAVESVQWADSCLGISYPNARCAQAVTPGYRVVLQAGGRDYELHTNADGTAVVSATASLTWHREGGLAGFCDDLYVSAFGEALPSSCKSGEALPAGRLTDAELAQLVEWSAKFGSVVIEISNPDFSDDMPVMVTMSGAGDGQPTEAEQQAIVAWAQAVYERVASN